jgi:hypothetical protein
MGSNPPRGKDVCLLSVLCVVISNSLCGAYVSSRGVLASVMFISEMDEPRRGSLGSQGLNSPRDNQYMKTKDVMEVELQAFLTKY